MTLAGRECVEFGAVFVPPAAAGSTKATSNDVVLGEPAGMTKPKVHAIEFQSA
jgi:hypothetical protein